MNREDWSAVSQALQTAINTIDALTDKVLPASSIVLLRDQTAEILKNARAIAEGHIP
jgi:hypothetical protein